LAADKAAPALAVKNLAAGYGRARMLHGIEFTLAPGEMLVVIGRNGVGKTTLIETLAGLTTHHGGQIILHGQAIEQMPAYRRSRLGLGWVPQEREVFSSLTVEENLSVVMQPGRWPLERIFELFPRLKARRGNYGNQLSGGEQQMLAIARALATNPSVLLLDEPVEGLAPLIVQELVEAIKRMRADGDLSILMVEQKYEIALAHSERCIVLDHGEIVHRSASAELLADHATLERLLAVGH
jgi:branched-chain amino acid transport system ATP-binding protein